MDPTTHACCRSWRGLPGRGSVAAHASGRNRFRALQAGALAALPQASTSMPPRSSGGRPRPSPTLSSSRSASNMRVLRTEANGRSFERGTQIHIRAKIVAIGALDKRARPRNLRGACGPAFRAPILVSAASRQGLRPGPCGVATPRLPPRCQGSRSADLVEAGRVSHAGLPAQAHKVAFFLPGPLL